MTFIFIVWAACSAAAACAAMARVLARIDGRHGPQARDCALMYIRREGPLRYALLTMLPAIGFPPVALVRALAGPGLRRTPVTSATKGQGR